MKAGHSLIVARTREAINVGGSGEVIQSAGSDASTSMSFVEYYG